MAEELVFTRYGSYPCGSCGGDHDKCLVLELPCPKCGELAQWHETVSYMESNEDYWRITDADLEDGFHGFTIKTNTTTIESITCPRCDA